MKASEIHTQHVRNKKAPDIHISADIWTDLQRKHHLNISLPHLKLRLIRRKLLNTSPRQQTLIFRRFHWFISERNATSNAQRIYEPDTDLTKSKCQSKQNQSIAGWSTRIKKYSGKSIKPSFSTLLESKHSCVMYLKGQLTQIKNGNHLHLFSIEHEIRYFEECSQNWLFIVPFL